MPQSTCPRCGGAFDQDPGPGKWRKFCRPDCGWIQHSCEVCEKEFFAPPEQRFCGQPCRLVAMSNRNRSDPEAQAVRGKLGGKVRGAQLRLQRSPNTYPKVSGTDQPEHRVVAEAVLGRPLGPKEVVHHEDLNKQNNHPHNLIVFPSQAEHARHHKLGHPGSPCACPGIRLKEVMA